MSKQRRYHAQTVSIKLVVGEREETWFPNPNLPQYSFSRAADDGPSFSLGESIINRKVLADPSRAFQAD